jgi:putative ATP-dependent endonuclease of OLD family
MKLAEIIIENFRGIRSLHLPLDNLTVLIGENNVGKSSVLEALRLILARGFSTRRDGKFTEYDFHLQDTTATPQTAEPISILLHFAEKKSDEWPEAIIQQMSEVMQFDNKGLYHIRLRAIGKYQAATATFETKWGFLDEAGAELITKNAAPFTLLARFAPLFFLSALRSASQEFGERGQFWGSFLKSIDLPEDRRLEVEEMLHNVNTSVINANTGLTEVTRKIAEANKLVPLDSTNPVVLEAIPTRIFEMVGKVQVHLKSNSGVKLPLQRHGEGTQSLAVLMLFQAFTAVSLTEAYTPDSTPILALEEPEAHLHPSAIRTLGSFLNDMPGQTIITSHSGDLVSRVPISSLRRIYKQNGETKVGQLVPGVLTDRELQLIDYTIRLNRGHFLFSHCWLLVEGESDFHLMPILFEVMGYSQDQISFSVLEFSQVFEKGESFIKLAKSLGIQWLIMIDGDAEGKKYINRVNAHLDTGEAIIDRAMPLTNNDIEHEFWHNGFDAFILNMVLPQTQNQISMQTDGNDVEKTKRMIGAAINQAGSKPAFAQALANEVRQRGASSIPQSIQGIINRVVQLAGG